MIAFVDNELYEKVEKLVGNKTLLKQEYPEQEFLASCLRVGLTIKDLKELTYIEAQKTLYSFLDKDDKNDNNTRKATQADIDKLLK